MRTQRRLTLGRKLLISFAVACVLVAALMIVGNQVIREDASRLERALTEQVRPLARLNRLQAQVNAIRVLEVEMPRLVDLFAVSNQIDILQSERRHFDQDLGLFLRELRGADAAQAVGLAESWQRYQSDLENVVKHAASMELDAVQRIATFESAGRFKTISRVLKQLADATELRARAAFEQATAEHDRQRRTLVFVSGTGLGVLAIWLGFLGRSVTRRLWGLRDAALDVAEGRAEHPITASGNDELTDLATAFGAMQERVRAREQALKASHEDLEQRVQDRTRELHDANARMVEEIERRRLIEERLEVQARFDNLTGLPNRMLAMDRLGQAIGAAQRARESVVLMFLDLDGFKAVNDTYGHQGGDALLAQAAKRLRRAVRSGDTVARLGGDEFLVILGGVTDPRATEAIAEEIVGAFVPPFDIGVGEASVSASVGISVFPRDGEGPESLLRHADLAMYEAKDSGRNTFRFFDGPAQDATLRRTAIDRELRGALQRGELAIAYQPLFTTLGRRLAGAEALLRWQSPTLGSVAPEEFIPVAERSNLIVQIGEWVLRTAMAQAREWRERGWERPRIAVNVSPRQFRGETLPSLVRECLSMHGLAPDTLQLEVTEGLLVRNHAEIQALLEQLGQIGVGLVMDDFGTGYSSLSYLKRFPFTAIKIDREFVDGLPSDIGDCTLVVAAVRMGIGLGLSVTAEGVETEEQIAFLAEHGCDLVQGYLLGRPEDAEEFAMRWIRTPVAA